MGTNCAPPDAYLFCLVMRETSCCLFQTIIKLKFLKQLTLPRYLGDLLYIDIPQFEHMTVQIYPTELQLNKASFFDTEVPFLTWLNP